MSIGKPLEFGCNACGKCCNSPPTMEVLEALRLGSTFSPLFFIAFEKVVTSTQAKRYMALPESYIGKGALQETIKHKLWQGRKAAYRTVLDTNHGKWFVNLIALDLHLLNNNTFERCPAQDPETARCSVYQDRPEVCRLLPGTSNYAGHVERIQLVNFKKEFGCTNDAQELIFDGEDLVGSPKIARDRIGNMRDATKGIASVLGMRALEEIIDTYNIFSEDELAQVLHNNNNYLYVSHANVLSGMIAHNLITPDIALHFVADVEAKAQSSDLMGTQDVLAEMTFCRENWAEVSSGQLFNEIHQYYG